MSIGAWFREVAARETESREWTSQLLDGPRSQGGWSSGRSRVTSPGRQIATTTASAARLARPGNRPRPGKSASRLRSTPISHGPEPDPQLLDHRPHRPREVDARGPGPPADRDGLRARDARPAARLDGARARARDHDQGAGGTRPLEGARAQPHRHAGARRLHVRGLALAAGVRGRRPRRGRCSGDRGADARQRVPGDRERPRDRPRRQQDRPPVGGPRRRSRGGRRAPRRKAGRRRAHLGQDRRQRRPGARCDRRADPRAERRRRRAAARARVRLLVRPVPRRDRVRARRRRSSADRRARCMRWRWGPTSRPRSSASWRPGAFRSRRSRRARSAMS